jgi:magnesium-transporting ATPase (P-type)
MEQRTLSEKNLLLRGSVLRATEWAVCCVTYTGADTKLSLNSKKTPSKLSSVDRIVNRTLVVAISVMLLVCLISMVFSIVWENEDSDAHYLCLKKSDSDDRYTNGGGCESGSTSSILTIFTFATLYNNFVCISMYVSLEMVYLCQSYFLSNDLHLYDESTDTPAECHTSGTLTSLFFPNCFRISAKFLLYFYFIVFVHSFCILIFFVCLFVYLFLAGMCADLGQVKYVLSDKTGTLTKNLMVVQHFSIAEKVFGDPITIDGGEGEPPITSAGPGAGSCSCLRSCSCSCCRFVKMLLHFVVFCCLLIFAQLCVVQHYPTLLCVVQHYPTLLCVVQHYPTLTFE